jgi:hypothetical protein
MDLARKVPHYTSKPIELLNQTEDYYSEMITPVRNLEISMNSEREESERGSKVRD